MKKIISFVVIIIAVVSLGMSALAKTDTRASNIRSRGNIDFDNGAAVIYAADLTYLADEIDTLEDTYKTKTLDALNAVGTYYKSDGTATFNKEENAITSSEAVSLSFGTLADGIKNSQNIPTERTYSGTLPGEDAVTTGNISAAVEDNLSLGKSAWVEGELIIGTGTDNKRYYEQGYIDGIGDKIPGNAIITYTYHQHTGSPSGGGCYTVLRTGTHRVGCSGAITCNSGPYGPDTSGNMYWTGDCPVCGYHATSHTSGAWMSCPNGRDETYSYYDLGCRMDENTIISVEIIWERE